MKKGKRLSALWVVLTLLIGILSGCAGKAGNASGENNTNNTTVSASQNTANETKSGITRYDFSTTSGVATTLDFHLASGMAPYTIPYETLYKYDNNNNVVLGLAESVDISADGLTYTYTIRNDAYYNNGEKVKAQDFEYGWKRLANPNTAAPYGYLVYNAGIKNAYSVIYEGADIDTLGIKALDEKTLLVEFDSVVPFKELVLVFPQFAPVSQAWVEKCGDQYGLTVETAPLSAGTMYAVEWEKDVKNVWAYNPYYYDVDSVTANTVTIIAAADNATAVMLWESGQVDFVTLSGDSAALYQNNPAFTPKLMSTLYYLTPNIGDALMQNYNFRMALALAIDKKDIADNIIKNGALPANFAVPTDFAYDSGGVSFREEANASYLETNKELALSYYEKAKQELGQDKFEIVLGYQSNETRAAVAQYIQQELQNTLPGVTVTLAVEKTAAGKETLRAGNFQIYLNVWNGDYQDATTFLDMWMTGNSYNYGRWSNVEYDRYLEDSYSKDSLDHAARIQDLINAEAVLLNDAAIIPIVQPTNAYLINADFDVPWCTKGFRWDHAVKK